MVKFVLNCVVKFVVKFKNCHIGTKIGVVVDIDPMTKRQKDKTATRQKTKR